MHPFTLQPPLESQTRISGDVTVHPTAVLAPGTLLQADANSYLVIGAGVCVGMGAVLHASGGTLHIDTGVNLGAGVLIIGQGQIGAQSCIGSASTLINPQLVAGQMVAPGSLLSADLVTEPATQPTTAAPAQVAPPAPEYTYAPATPMATATVETGFEETSIPKPPPGHVIGQVFLSQLRMTLFPYNQQLNPEKIDPLPPDD